MIVTPFLITLSCRFPHLRLHVQAVITRNGTRSALHSTKPVYLLHVSCPEQYGMSRRSPNEKRSSRNAHFLKNQRKHTRNRNNTIHQGNKVHIVMWPTQKKIREICPLVQQAWVRYIGKFILFIKTSAKCTLWYGNKIVWVLRKVCRSLTSA